MIWRGVEGEDEEERLADEGNFVKCMNSGLRNRVIKEKNVKKNALKI